MTRRSLGGRAMISETRTENRAAWAVSLTGAPLADLKARAKQIREASTDTMTSYFIKQLDGVEIQMEFQKGGDA